MIEALTSVKNPLVQRMRTLKSAKGREAEGQMLIEGEKMIREALGAGLVPGDVLIDEGILAQLNDLIKMLETAGAKLYQVPYRILEAVSDTVTPSGVCASFTPPKKLDLSQPPARIVALDGVQDPGNAGTIWRTADAAGFGGMLLGAGSAEPTNPKVVRATMGSCFRLPAQKVPDLAQALAQLKADGYQIVATSLDGQDIYQRDALGEKIVLVIGSEAHGIRADVLALSDVRLKLPMRGGAESLNAAVAAGIILYELTRGI